MLDASLCNVVGSPISPPDGQWAELQQASVNWRPEPRQATEAAAAIPTPAEEAMLRAQQALLSARVGSLAASSCQNMPCSLFDMSVRQSNANASARRRVRFLAVWLWLSEQFPHSLLSWGPCFLLLKSSSSPSWMHLIE